MRMALSPITDQESNLYLQQFFAISIFVALAFFLFFISGPCARLSWPSCQLLSACQSTVSYRIVSYRIVKLDWNTE